jgi:hypothetical protein
MVKVGRIRTLESNRPVINLINLISITYVQFYLFIHSFIYFIFAVLGFELCLSFCDEFF